MELISRQQDQTTIVSVRGSIDALTASEVTSFLMRCLENQQTKLVLDLGGVDFMSSAGLRAILAVLKESRQRGGDLRLATATPGVEKVLKISGFTSILKDYPSVTEAVASFQ